MSPALEGKVALVTGSTRGLGFAIAAAYVAEGATVVVTGRTEQGCRDAIARLDPGDRASFVVGDASTANGAHALVDHAIVAYGRIDVLVNNIGGVVGNAMGPFLDVTTETWAGMFDLNIHSMFHTTQRAVPAMVERGTGRVINMSSVEGKEGAPGLVAYSTTKHAVCGFTKALAHELGTTGVTVNALCPGLCATEGVLAAEAHAASVGMSLDELLSSFTGKTAVKRLIQPAEVAALAVFLAGDAASAITGATLSVDGGQSAY